MKITIAILAYNEEDNLRWILPEINKYVLQIGADSVEYLIVDSMTPTDNTKEVCEEFGARYINQEEKYYGGAMRTAFKHATGDVFIILDADGSQDYTQIPQLYEAFCQNADVVIGSRYVKGGETEDSKLSQIMSHILNILYGKVMKLNVKDVSDSFRIYHTCDLKELYLSCENFDIAEEILYKLNLQKKGKLVIKEVPIKFVKREIGDSKRSLVKFIVSFAKTLLQFMVINTLSINGYIPEVHDKKAKRITDICVYIFFGVFTTIINLLVFIIVAKGLKVNYLIANIFAWVTAVIFAFVTNKTCVFNSWNWDKTILKQEFTLFISSRVFTGVADMLALWMLVHQMNLDKTIAKFFVNIGVIIANYLLSRFGVWGRNPGYGK